MITGTPALSLVVCFSCTNEAQIRVNPTSFMNPSQNMSRYAQLKIVPGAIVLHTNDDHRL